MRKIRKHSLAENDLIDIWEYGFAQWGAQQADKYLDELDERIALLAEQPEMGSMRHYVRDGYRMLLINSHAVYYRVTSTAIHIIRVLHSRMDPERHL